MGDNDSAQVTDLVGLYILNRMALEFPQLYGGLYRDDGLLVLPDANPQHCDRIRKRLHVFFRDIGLSITVSANINGVRRWCSNYIMS